MDFSIPKSLSVRSFKKFPNTPYSIIYAILFYLFNMYKNELRNSHIFNPFGVLATSFLVLCKKSLLSTISDI
jgi:hypothetical protein